MKKYKATDIYNVDMHSDWGGLGYENNKKFLNGETVDLNPEIAKPFIDNKMLEEAKGKGDK